MNLGLVVFLVIVALFVLCAKFLKHRRARLAGGSDPGPVIVAFGAAFPQEAIRDVAVTTDGKTTFLRLADDKTGLVQTSGNRYAMRIIEPGSITMEGPVGVRGLSFSFRDAHGPAVTALFSRADEAAEVSLWLCGSFVLNEADSASVRGGHGSRS